MSKKRIVFLTGTRADFGKLKSLILIAQNSDLFEVNIFVTGMHMLEKYGKTILEVEKSGIKNIYPFINHDSIDHMDRNLSKTIDGFSHYISEIKPDLIVVHGDRIEPLAGAIVGSLNNILVGHIEGGEISGTIDELIRHSISKLSHIHFTSNDEAKRRLIQMGEYDESIFTIGSPDLDLMNSNKLPSLEFVKDYYEIPFNQFSILIFHPVTTEKNEIKNQIRVIVDAIIESGLNYIVIYPNNDLGSDIILNEYEKFNNMPRIKMFPSIRFEYFLVFLKNCKFIIGNSSTGIREAPYYQTPTINVGNRQKNRVISKSIKTVDFFKKDILFSINEVNELELIKRDVDFGEGDSDIKFLNILKSNQLWQISNQKQFRDI
jgi:UDP-N-acetylglucosamine 2-epimerase (hydrolysing)